ncbi:MAG: GNAT family N-acetyltransferase [Haloglomus sp.]
MPGPAFREGDRVALHTVEREDLSLLAQLRNDPDIRRDLTFEGPETDVERETWFEEHVSDRDAEDEGAQFMVVPRDGDARPVDTDGGTVNVGDGDVTADESSEGDDAAPQPVGYASLFDLQRPAGHAEVSVTIAPEYRRQGYAADALAELVAYGIEELRLTKVRARALAPDEASRALLEHVGFQAGETRREAKRVAGEHVDVVGYSLLADDWFDRPGRVRGIPDNPPGATAAERGHHNPFATDTHGGTAAGEPGDAGDPGADHGGGR